MNKLKNKIKAKLIKHKLILDDRAKNKKRLTKIFKEGGISDIILDYKIILEEHCWETKKKHVQCSACPKKACTKTYVFSDLYYQPKPCYYTTCRDCDKILCSNCCNTSKHLHNNELFCETCKRELAINVFLGLM